MELTQMIGFNPEEAKPFSQVLIDPELGIEHILGAFRRFGIPHYNALLMNMNGYNFKDGLWHQVEYPGPVVHIVPFNTGYLVTVYANGNGHSNQKAWDLTGFLSAPPQET